MKKIFLLFIMHISLHSACPQPEAGDRLWNLAATGLITLESVESNLEQLIILVENDFNGTYSVTAEIEDELEAAQNHMSNILSDAELIIEQLPIIVDSMETVGSKLSVVELSLSDISFVDMSGVFTALEVLSQDVSSALELIAAQLEQVKTNITQAT